MSGAAMWWLTLGVGAVVVAVVALLLGMVVGTARRIRSTLEEIWVGGPSIANNTAHVDLVRRMNLVADDIVGAAERIDANASRILRHAEGCPGCPYCVTGWGAAGAGATGGAPPGGGPAGIP